MNELMIAAGQPLTMSSREIAELVESRPDTVKVAMERLQERGLITFTSMTEKSAGGRPGTVYLVGKRDSYIVVAQLSPEFTARLVDRWQELEEQVAKPQFALPQSLPEALRLAADLAEENMQLEHKVAEQAPKVAALERISAGVGTLTMTEAAKVLGVKRSVLTARLHAEGWIYRQNNAWVAYDAQIKNGRLQYKEANYTDEKSGMECCKPYCHVTPKGMAKISLMFSQPANDHHAAASA